MSTDDFSTLCTTLPHHLIKDKLITDLIEHTFSREKAFIIPRHLCLGVYSFRLSVRPYGCSFVSLFVRDSVPFVELLQSFTLKFLQWGISQQPLIRKHSYLDHRYPVGSAFIPWIGTPGSMAQGGARGQNVGHL